MSERNVERTLEVQSLILVTLSTSSTDTLSYSDNNAVFLFFSHPKCGRHFVPTNRIYIGAELATTVHYVAMFKIYLHF